MADNRGIKGGACGFPESAMEGAPLLVKTVTCKGAGTKKVWDGQAPFKLRIMQVLGTMLTAGTSSDTCKLTDGTNDITDDADISAFGDKTQFSLTEYDDGYYDIDKGDTVQVVTANGSTSADSIRIDVLFYRVN